MNKIQFFKLNIGFIKVSLSVTITLAMFVLLPVMESIKKPNRQYEVQNNRVNLMENSSVISKTNKKKPKSNVHINDDALFVKSSDFLDRKTNYDLMLKDDFSFQPFSYNLTLNRKDSFCQENDLIFNLTDIDEPPLALIKISPVYPFEAKVKGLEGEVLMSFVIDDEGKVKNIKAEKAIGDVAFIKAAKKVLRKWKFKPAIIRGQEVAVKAKMPFHFRLEENKS